MINSLMDCDSEPALVQHLLLNLYDYFPNCYLIECEWEVYPGHSQGGVGDLLFGDGFGRYIVVEVKYIPGCYTGSTAKKRRHKARRTVEQQAARYARDVPKRFPHATEIEAYIFTNDWQRPGLVRIV